MTEGHSHSRRTPIGAPGIERIDPLRQKLAHPNGDFPGLCEAKIIRATKASFALFTIQSVKENPALAASLVCLFEDRGLRHLRDGRASSPWRWSAPLSG